MTATLELINAISNGDAIEIENAFNSAMADKISSKIDDMRVSIAQAMFNAQVEEPAAEEPTEE
jgi:hypothetical protein